ncbi:uncharacterized protein LOC116944920 isoform X1 [Petromyzon marinus]|uniref:uncharacterized protein LOC116944920 isoform X1 n=1 Tax=Petromyzon marinus TaxID=7757 RepID=UPI003F70B170
MKMDHDDGGNEGTDLDASEKAYDETHKPLEDMDEDGVIMVEGSRYCAEACENVLLSHIAETVDKVHPPRKPGLGDVVSQAPLDVLDIEETSYPTTDSQDAAALSAEGTTADEAHDDLSFHVSELLDSDALPGSLEKQQSFEVADEDVSYRISELLDSDPVAISVSLAEDATLNISNDDTFQSENSPELAKDISPRRMWRVSPEQGIMASTSGPARDVGSGQHRASLHEELGMESADDYDDEIEEGGRTSEEESDLPYDGDLDEGSDLNPNSASNTSGTGQSCAHFSELHEKGALSLSGREQSTCLINLALENDTGDREGLNAQSLSRDINAGLRYSLADEMGTQHALVIEEEHLLRSNDDVVGPSNNFYFSQIRAEVFLTEPHDGKYLSDTVDTIEHSSEARGNTCNLEDEIVCVGSANEPQNTVHSDQEMQYKAHEHVLITAQAQHAQSTFQQQPCDMLHREQEVKLEICNDVIEPTAQNSKAAIEQVSHPFAEDELSSRYYIEAETMPEISFTESVDAVAAAKQADFLIKDEFYRSHKEGSMQIIPEHDQWLPSADKDAQTSLIIDRESVEMGTNVNGMGVCNSADPYSQISCIKKQTLSVLKSDNCAANAPSDRSILLDDNQKQRRGQVHYPLPNLSMVEPKIRSQKKAKTKVDRSPSSTKASVKLARSVSHKPLVATVREVLNSTELPLVSCKTRCVTPEPQEGTPAMDSDNRSPNSKTSADMVRQLQEDYDKLLTKYAEAENTIDHLRLGAKVSLFADAPKPASSAIHVGTLNTPSRPVTLTIPKPQQAWLIQPGPGSQDHPDGDSGGAGCSMHEEEATPGMCLTRELASQALCFRDKVNEFQELLNSGKLSLENQQEAFEQLRRDQDGLERQYMARKEEHRALQLQTHRCGTASAGHFDPHREVEGSIFQLGMSLEEIKEQMDESRCRPSSPDTAPASTSLSATAVKMQRVTSSHSESPLSVVIHQRITLDLVEGSETDNEVGRESMEERMGDQERSRSETHTEPGESDKGGDTMEEDRGSAHGGDSSGLSSQSYHRGSQATGWAGPRQHRSVAAPAGRQRRERAQHPDVWAQGKTDDRSQRSTANAKEDSKSNTCRSRDMDGREEDELFGGPGKRAPTPQPHSPLQPSQQPPLPPNVMFNSVEPPSLFAEHRHQRDMQSKEHPNQKTTEAGEISRHVSHISLASSGISLQGSFDNFQRHRHSIKEERVISPETDSGFVGSENGRITGRASSLAESLRLTARSSSSHPSLPEECESDAPAVAPVSAEPARQRGVWSDAEASEAVGAHGLRVACRPSASSSRWNASAASDWDSRGCQGRDRLDDLEREDVCSLDGFPCRPLKKAELGGLDGEHPRGNAAWSRAVNGLQSEDGDPPSRPCERQHSDDLAAAEGSVLRGPSEEVEAREPGVTPRAKRTPSEGAYPNLSRLSVGPRRRSKNVAWPEVKSVPRSEPWTPPRLRSSRATLSLADLRHRDEEAVGTPTASPPWATPPRRAATRGHHSRDHLLTGPYSGTSSTGSQTTLGVDYKSFPPGRPSGKLFESDHRCPGCSSKARTSERHWDSGTKRLPCPVCNGSGVYIESSSHDEDDLVLGDLRDETERSPQSRRQQHSNIIPGLYSGSYVYPAFRYGLPSALYVSPYHSRFYLPEAPPRSRARPRGVSAGRARSEDISVSLQGSERELCKSLDRAIRTAEGMRRTSQRMVEFLSRDIAHVHTAHQFLFR